MKQIRRRISSPFYTLPFLLFIFVLVVAASWLLASSGFDGVFSASLFTSPQGILVLVIVPLGLLAFLGILFFGLVSESIHQGDASRIGNRLFFGAALAVLMATLPQTVIVGRFVSSALSTWFDHSVSEALVSADELVDLYSAERSRLILKVSDRFLNGLAISNYRARPVDWMTDIRSIDPGAAACQVYLLDEKDPAAPAYSPVVETGDSGRFVPRNRLDGVRNGFFSLGGNEELWRYGQIVRYGNHTYVCIYTSAMPEGFSARAERIRSASGQAAVVDTLKPYLPLMGAWIYLLFGLPIVLMVIIIIWYLARRVTDPVRAIAEQADRLAAGDPSFRIVIPADDELGQTAELLNIIAESSGPRKTPDKRPPVRV